MTCPQCGHTGDGEDALFCTSCGETLDPEGGPTFVPEAKLAPFGGVAGREQPDGVSTTTLAAGTKVIVLERQDTWARIVAESGFHGWVEHGLLADPDLPEGSPPTRRSS